MLKINTTRLIQNIEALAQIGRTAVGGVSRPALSEADLAGRRWFEQQVKSAGLRFQADGAGNLSAILPAARPDAPTLLAGSHLDTVPNGGRFDGALGVLAALEALQTIREAGLALPYHLEAISFTDEEGSVLGMLGSRALTGQFTQTDLTHFRQDSDQLAAGLARLSLAESGIFSARRQPERLAGFIELHIEQGARLEEAGLQIGVVTAIVGIRSYWLFFRGSAGHSGTTPMDKRADALWGAADFVTRARKMVTTRFSPGVMNCGQIALAPGSFNIIPAEVRLALEFRHGSEDKLDQMEAALLELAGEIAEQYHLSLSSELTEVCRAAPLDKSMMQTVETAATRLGLRQTRLLSLAGHDAQTLSPFTPTALIFVPSVGGASHSPLEYTQDEDVINGANVLLQTLLVLAENG